MRLIPGVATVGCLLAVSSPLVAQSDSIARSADSISRMVRLSPLAVTATKSERLVFRTATPVQVIDSSVIREELPNGVADLFRNLPGVDVTGVGANQGRLLIRGQRGQRILLTEDGLRLNNARRQQDFGELPALTDLNNVARVEVVRGPASVLYGTDAIGGVVNQITMAPPPRGRDGLFGSVLYRYSSADAQNLGHLRVSGRADRVGFGLSVGIRNAEAYSAPAGVFGRLKLAGAQLVNDAGVRDRNYTGNLSIDLGDHSQFGLRFSRYEARDAGFGYVNPKALGDTTGVVVRLLYPNQAVNRLTARFESTALTWGLADRVAVAAFFGANNRDFDQQINIPFGAPLPPTAGLAIRSHNVTNIGSYGTRVELAKVVAGRHLITYGGDWYLDRSENSDSSTNTTTVFGPPTVRRSTVPSVPNAYFATAGAFAQGEFALTQRLQLWAGVRAQTTRSSIRQTPGLPASGAGVPVSNGTVVGNVSGLFSVSRSFNVVATVGRAFRAPNLIERYFDGATAEGNGYQVASPDLTPETSLNIDLGFKLRTERVSAEATYFVNTIHNGIRIVPLGTKIGNFPAFQNQNVAQLRDRGVEALAEVQLGRGFAVLGHLTTLKSKNVDRSNPVGDSYGSKLGGALSWREARGRFRLGYEVRHQGARKDIDLGGGPVGDVLPAFTVHAVRGGFRLPRVGRTTPEVDVAVTNLTNQLYAEASNTSFFRPEPRRSLALGFRLTF